MKKKILVLMVMVVSGLLAGCGDNSEAKQLNRIEAEVSQISEKLDKSESNKAEIQSIVDAEKKNEELLEAKEDIAELESAKADLEKQIEELEEQLKEATETKIQDVTDSSVIVEVDYGDLKFTEEEGKLYEVTNSHPHLYTKPSCKHEDEVIDIPYLISKVVDKIEYEGESLNVVKAEDGTYLFSYETIGLQLKEEDN